MDVADHPGPGEPAPRNSSSCAKCGACAPVCPVYRITGREYHTGRGKLHLLSKLDPSQAGAVWGEILSHCLLCGACSKVCSRGLPVAEDLAAARSELNRLGGEHQLLRALGSELPAHPRLLKALAPLARLLLHHKLPPDSGLNLRLGREGRSDPGPSVGSSAGPPAGPSVSPSAGPSAAGSSCEESDPVMGVGPELAAAPPPFSPGPAAPEQNPPIFLFEGCYSAFLEPGIGQAVVSLLAKNLLGRAEIAAQRTCCGLAQYSSGRLEQARSLARRNIAAHPGPTPVVVACASCATHLGRYPELLADDPLWAGQAREFAGRVTEFSRFLACRTPDPQPQPTASGPAMGAQTPEPRLPLPPMPDDQRQTTANLRVLYHDPCHLRFTAEPITKEPRLLLNRLPGLELCELPHGPQCCGQGGLFHLAQPATAAAILQRLTSEFQQTGADIVTTACSGCLLHWRQARAEGQHQARVIHLAQLLDQGG